MASLSHSVILDMSFHVIIVLFNKHFLRGHFSPAPNLVVGVSLERFFGSVKQMQPLVTVMHLCRHWMMSVYHCHCLRSGVESQVMLCSLWFFFFVLKAKK